MNVRLLNKKERVVYFIPSWFCFLNSSECEMFLICVFINMQKINENHFLFCKAKLQTPLVKTNQSLLQFV